MNCFKSHQQNNSKYHKTLCKHFILSFMSKLLDSRTFFYKNYLCSVNKFVAYDFQLCDRRLTSAGRLHIKMRYIIVYYIAVDAILFDICVTISV